MKHPNQIVSRLQSTEKHFVQLSRISTVSTMPKPNNQP
jgi:hypothetical protein